MRNRGLGTIATLLSMLLVISTTVQAGPIPINGVVQVVGRYQSASRVPELRLRSVSQSYNSLVDNSVSQSARGSRASSSQTSTAQSPDGSTAAGSPAADSLLSGITVNSDDPQGKLDIISQGDLEGSICDCGEIPYLAGGGFPKWPLLLLAGIPFFFIHHDTENTPLAPMQTQTSTPTPTPTSTPTGVPEPASLLLLGSGLTAVLTRIRRRRSRQGLATAIAATKEA